MDVDSLDDGRDGVHEVTSPLDPSPSEDEGRHTH